MDNLLEKKILTNLFYGKVDPEQTGLSKAPGVLVRPPSDLYFWHFVHCVDICNTILMRFS